MSAWSTVPASISERLAAKPLGYKGLLPVQAAVIPHISRTIASGLQMDYMLNAPTGSGKTLCFLVPLIEMLRREHNCLNTAAAEGEAAAPSNPFYVAGTHTLRALVLVPTTALGSQISEVAKALLKGTGIRMIDLCDDANNNDAAARLVRRVELPSLATSSSSSSSSEVHYYSNVDLIIATPNRIIKHITGTEGFSLRGLKMVVMDEADQILSGAYTTMVHRIISACEEATSAAASASAGSSIGAVSSHNGVLYKILCSATMTAHITRVSDFRLRNCKYFSLATDGSQRTDLEGAEVRAPAHLAAAHKGPLSLLKARFVMPPGLHEHAVFVQDRFRHASLLKVIYGICGMEEPTLEGLTAATEEGAPAATKGARIEEEKEKKDEDDKKEKTPVILVFCDSAESARVVGQFVNAAGFRSLEFTAHATDATRRQALYSMQRGCEEDAVPLIVVTTDALMRGIDLPGVKHVVMYDPPTSLQQYVHRVGRTARALREGHAYLLLSRLGPSGTTEDGQVAHFKAMRANIEASHEVTLGERSKHFISDEFAALCSVYLAAAQGASVRQVLMERSSALLSKKGAVSATVNVHAAGSAANDASAPSASKAAGKEHAPAAASAFVGRAHHQQQSGGRGGRGGGRGGAGGRGFGGGRGGAAGNKRPRQ